MVVMQFDLWGPHSSETGVFGDTDLVTAMKHFYCPECSQEHSYKRSTGRNDSESNQELGGSNSKSPFWRTPVAAAVAGSSKREPVPER